jgi:hypothetical protein
MHYEQLGINSVDIPDSCSTGNEGNQRVVDFIDVRDGPDAGEPPRMSARFKHEHLPSSGNGWQCHPKIKLRTPEKNLLPELEGSAAILKRPRSPSFQEAEDSKEEMLAKAFASFRKSEI